jgi:hypothetical protein
MNNIIHIRKLTFSEIEIFFFINEKSSQFYFIFTAQRYYIINPNNILNISN